jgi:kexin
MDRPDLNWRDYQYLTVRTSHIVNSFDAGWQKTAAGYHFNHKYGFGTLDAYKIVEVAKNWTSVNPQTKIRIPYESFEKPMPDNSTPITQVITITAANVSEARLKNIEQITVSVTIVHQRRGDVVVKLISPNNVESLLLPGRQYDEDQKGFQNWTMMSVVHWYLLLNEGMRNQKANGSCK